MVQRGEEESWMASHRVGETSLSDSGPSNRPPTYGIHGTTAAATNFFDQEGTGYFGELEEALMQGVNGIRSGGGGGGGGGKDYFTARPPTLEIFPSWPMRFQQDPRENSQSAGSTDSGSAQITISQLESESPVSRKASSEQPADQKQKQKQQQQQQQGIMASSDASRAGPTPNYQQRAQEKKRTGGSTTAKDPKMFDAKTLRRLAQNREAARKSRLRKKAYVQQLESSKIRLQQLEQELQRARSEGLFFGGGSASGDMSSGAAMFDMEYARWLDDNNRRMSELQGGLQAHFPDSNLGIIVDECITHYDELFRLKGVAAKSDVFHLLTGMWTTPAERCFLWMGGFKPSELLKILMPQLDPLTEQQLIGICNLQQSSQQAEEALSQGLEQLHQSLADTVASGSLTDGTGITNYMGHMAIALGKLANLEGFIQQADNLRQQTIHQMRRILTIRQAARCFLAIGEYRSRLRALSSLWASRPQENLIPNESVCPTTTEDLQAVHHPMHHHFSAF